MSFFSDVRTELCAVLPPARHCQLAELAALLNACGELAPDSAALVSDNALVTRRFTQLVAALFRVECRDAVRGHPHEAALPDGRSAARALQAAGLLTGGGPPQAAKAVSPVVVMAQCCKRAYIRGSFIAVGALSNPERSYHLEFAFNPPDGPLLAPPLCALLSAFGLSPRVMRRKAQAVVYLKEAQHIADALNIMEAHKSLLRFEELRVVKEMRGDVNRRCNFETANLNKTVDAAVNQIDGIRYVAEHAGLGMLSKPLEEVARLRLEYESASLKEIGAMLSEPLSKSGVNHRLRKVSLIAEELRREKEQGI